MNEVIKVLVSRGGVASQLDGTNAQVVHINGKDLYFIGGISRVVPYIYGIFASQDVYMQAILQEAGVGKFQSDVDLSVLVTSSGYIAVLAAGKNVTPSVGTTIKELAKTVLSLIPHAGYVSFEVKNSIVTNVTFSIDAFVSSPMYNQETASPTATVIADLLCT